MPPQGVSPPHGSAQLNGTLHNPHGPSPAWSCPCRGAEQGILQEQHRAERPSAAACSLPVPWLLCHAAVLLAVLLWPRAPRPEAVPGPCQELCRGRAGGFAEQSGCPEPALGPAALAPSFPHAPGTELPACRELCCSVSACAQGACKTGVLSLGLLQLPLLQCANHCEQCCAWEQGDVR